MKSLLLILSCVLIVIITTATTLAENLALTIYEESFDGYSPGNDPTGWTDANDSFEISVVSNTNVYKLTGGVGTTGFAYYEGLEITSLQNYRIDALMFKNAGVEIGIIAGLSTDAQSYYKFYWDNGLGKIKLVKVEDDEITELTWGTDASTVPNWSYRLFRFEKNGPLLTCTVYTRINSNEDWNEDNLQAVESINYHDVGSALYGGAGIYAKFETTLSSYALADNFKVSKLFTALTHEETFKGYSSGIDPTNWVDVYDTLETDPNGYTSDPNNPPLTYVYKLTGTNTTGFAYFDSNELKYMRAYTIDSVMFKNAGVSIGIVGGISDDENSYYQFYWSYGAGKLKLQKVQNGDTTVLCWGKDSSAVPNWEYRLFRLEIYDHYITGTVYEKIDPNGEWNDDNLAIVESISGKDEGHILTGYAGIYANFGSVQSIVAQADCFRVYQPFALIHEDDFDGYSSGTDPAGWIDSNNTFITSPSDSSTIYKLQGSSGTIGVAYYNNNVNNLGAYLIDALLAKNAGVAIGVVGGISSDENSFYRFYWSNGAGKLKLEKVLNGSSTVLAWGTNTSAMPNWTYCLFRLEVYGDHIAGTIYERIDPNFGWYEDNLNVVETLKTIDSGTKLIGGAGIYAKFESAQATCAQAEYFRVAQPTHYDTVTDDEKDNLIDIFYIQAQAVIAYNKAISLDRDLQEAKFYESAWTKIPTNLSSDNNLVSIESALVDIELDALPLIESHFGRRIDRNGKSIPFLDETQNMLCDSAARSNARDDFEIACIGVLSDTNDLISQLRSAINLIQISLKNNASVTKWHDTFTFDRKSSASLYPDGTTSGLIYGYKLNPYENVSHVSKLQDRVATLMGSQIELGVYQYSSDAYNRAATRNRGVQLIAPSANHNGAMAIDVDWYNAWHIQNPNEPDNSLDRRLPLGWGSYPSEWTLDFRHPDVNSRHQAYLEDTASTYTNDTNVSFYTISWEPSFGSVVPSQGHIYINLSDAKTTSGITQFRHFLEGKFGTINALNASWGTNYNSFGSINPPNDPMYLYTTSDPNFAAYTTSLSEGNTTPLYYEFNRWFKNSNTEWLEFCYNTLKVIDPNHPVSLSPCHGYYDGFLGIGQDAFQWAQGACDIYGSEWSLPLQEVFEWSVYRFWGKTMGISEEMWSYPNTWYGNPETRMRSCATSNIWRMAAWGRKIVGIYQMGDAFANRNIMEFNSGFYLLRQSAAMLPVVIDEVRASEDIWLNNPIIEPDIVVIKPSTSQMVLWPMQAVEKVMEDIHNLLYKNNYHYAIVPEEYFVDGNDSLDDYKVVILPYAIHFPANFSSSLLDWVESGGTAIIAGVAGHRTSYGQIDEEFLEYVFGAVTCDLDTYPKWNFSVSALPGNGRYCDSDFNDVFISRYGANGGQVLVAPYANDIKFDTSTGQLVLDLIKEKTDRFAYATEDNGNMEIIGRTSPYEKESIYFDNFSSYANGSDPDNWTDLNSSLEIDSTNDIFKLTGGVGTTGFGYYSEDEVSSLNDFILDSLMYKNAGVSIGVIGGIETSNTYYRFSWNAGASKLKLEKVVNGTSTVLAWGTNTSAMPNWSYRLFRLQVNGTKVTGTLYNRIDTDKDWTDNNLTVIESISVTDTGTILKGAAGIYAKFEYSGAVAAQVDFFKVSRPSLWYVTLINYDKDNWTRATINLADRYTCAVDRGIEKGIPVSLKERGSIQFFRTILAPGEGTVIELYPEYP
jgi:hypothetical protein